MLPTLPQVVSCIKDVTHSDCLLAARDAGEPEVDGFPDCDSALDLPDIEARMGFIAPEGHFLTRDETEARFGFYLAEEQDDVA